MVSLTPEARALLRAARSVDDPTDDDSRRIRASVLAKVGVVGAGAAVGATTSVSAFAKVSSLFASTAGKVGAAALVVVSLSAGPYAFYRMRLAHLPGANAPAAAAANAVDAKMARPTETRQTEAPVLPTVIGNGPQPVRPAPVAIAKPHPRSLRPARPPRPAPLAIAKAKSAKPPAATRVTSDLEGETRLLEDADDALRRSDMNAALELLAEHAAKYPSGMLSDEREGVRAIALCGAGRVAQGKEAADQFLTAVHNSSLKSRVRAACGINRTGD
jgi:hypothetical protein